jgi:hypothetical protein
MGMKQFVEPDINKFFDDLTQAEILSNKASFIGKGYINMTDLEMTGSAVPQVSRGSQLEANSVLWVADVDSSIGYDSLGDGINYMYMDTAGEFSFSQSAPQWSAIKGGWYKGNSRAVLKFACKKTSVYTCSNKVVLDSFGAMYQTVSYADPVYDFTSTDLTGEVIAEYTAAGTYTVDLAKGVYKVVLVAGGGSGGSGGSGPTGGSSGSGAAAGKSGGEVMGFSGGEGGAGGTNTDVGGKGGAGAVVVGYLIIAHRTKLPLIVGAGNGGNTMFSVHFYAHVGIGGGNAFGAGSAGAGGNGGNIGSSGSAGQAGYARIERLNI